MPLLVTGSVATDHLMSYPGRFADAIVVDKMDRLAVSFLVDDLQVRRGGCAANIAFGMAALGLHPVLVAAVGTDAETYRRWLEDAGVDCTDLHSSTTRHSARFVCTTDRTHAQIASFYPGAMAEAADLALLPVVERVGRPDFVVVAPNDPAAMVRHTRECRERGWPFVADPSQQLSSASGAEVRELVDGAAILLSNEYEAALIARSTGWSDDELLQRVGLRVTTLGPNGARIERAGAPALSVPAVHDMAAVEPTGVGDAFRAGFVGGLASGLDVETAAAVGCVLASYVIETVGTQEYAFDREHFLDRLRAAYGGEAATRVAACLLE